MYNNNTDNKCTYVIQSKRSHYAEYAPVKVCGSLLLAIYASTYQKY